MTPEHKFALLTTFGPAALAAVVAAIVSWFVTRYMIKHGPDYQEQLNDLRKEMGRVGSAQEGILAHHRELAAEEHSRREAERWHPHMEFRSDMAAMTNILFIRADKPFSVETVRLKTNSGAVVCTLNGAVNEVALQAETSIPAPEILKLIERDGDYLRNEKTVCRVECVLRVDALARSMPFEFPFRVLQENTRTSNGIALWRRLDGRL